MLKNYFNTTIRNLLRNKVYSSINIVGLSLGLACAILIILYTNDELSYDRFHENADNIYRVTNKRFDQNGTITSMGGNTGYFQGPKFTEGIPEIKSFLRVRSENRDIKQGREIKSQEFHIVDSNFFSVFSFPLLSGNPETALSLPKSIVITEEMAKRQFGTVDALNEIMFLKDNEKFEPYVVTGVARRCPQNSSIKFDALLPLQVSAEDSRLNENWFNFFLNTFVVLEPTADFKVVEAKMKKVYESDAKEAIKMMAEKFNTIDKVTYNLQPFIDLHLGKDYDAGNGLTDASNPMYSYILSCIAFFILAIASINFINLTVARSVKRAKEIGIRKVIGGDRGQLIIQFMGESFILCAAAFLFAIALVQLVLPTFNQLSNKALSPAYMFDLKLIVGYLLLFLLTCFLAGFYPALVISKYKPVQSLYNRLHLTGKNYLHQGLVVVQFALATLLIVATFTIFSQFQYLTTKQLGYDDSNVVIVRKSGMSRNDAKLFKDELLKNPNIPSVASRHSGRWGTIAKINGETEIQFEYETVDESYLPFYNIPVVVGRNFSVDFPSDSIHSVLVNETFVKRAGWKDPIGKEVNFWYKEDEKYTVIGVVKDHHYASLSEEIGPQMFTMKASNPYGLTLIKIRPKTETASLKHIEATFKKLFPITPYTYRFKDLENTKNYEAEAKWKQMMLFGAIFTIFISCIGLFGLSVLSAEKRTKEVGIRKILGASISAVVTTLSKDFLTLVAMALIIAMPVAWLLTNQWLENYPYRIGLDWRMFAAAGFLVVVLSLVTVSFQAVRAAITNPVDSLRNE